MNTAARRGHNGDTGKEYFFSTLFMDCGFIFVQFANVGRVAPFAPPRRSQRAPSLDAATPAIQVMTISFPRPAWITHSYLCSLPSTGDTYTLRRHGERQSVRPHSAGRLAQRHNHQQQQQLPRRRRRRQQQKKYNEFCCFQHETHSFFAARHRYVLRLMTLINGNVKFFWCAYELMQAACVFAKGRSNNIASHSSATRMGVDWPWRRRF